MISHEVSAANECDIIFNTRNKFRDFQASMYFSVYYIKENVFNNKVIKYCIYLLISQQSRRSDNFTCEITMNNLTCEITIFMAVAETSSNYRIYDNGNISTLCASVDALQFRFFVILHAFWITYDLAIFSIFWFVQIPG